MGFFDDLIKNVDKGLKAIEDGALEERLNKVADKLDKTTATVEKKLGGVADKPAQVLKVAEQKKDQLETKAQEVKEHVGKSIDGFRKKD